LEKIITKKKQKNKKKIMWGNHITIYSVLKKKITKLNSNQLNIKKIKLTDNFEKNQNKKENTKKKKNTMWKNIVAILSVF
jgi:hypothetical protein